MDFAPYQSASPETTRALSPPPQPESRRSFSPPSFLRSNGHARSDSRTSIPTAGGARPTSPRNSTSFSTSRPYSDDPGSNAWGSGSNSDLEAGRRTAPDTGLGSWVGGRREEVDLFETRLGIRMDYEACLAYLVLPPAGAVMLLVLEHRSDYVRFHAWQSSLLFSFLFIIHVIFSWSSFISWLLFVIDIGLIGYLTLRAYRDAETLDRCEVPFFGPLASSILDDE